MAAKSCSGLGASGVLQLVGLVSLPSPHTFLRRAKRDVLKDSADNGTVGAVNVLIPVKLHLLKMHPLVY